MSLKAACHLPTAFAIQNNSHAIQPILKWHGLTSLRLPHPNCPPHPTGSSFTVPEVQFAMYPPGSWFRVPPRDGGLCTRCSVIHSFHVHRCFKLVLCNLVCAIPLAYAKLEFAQVPSLNKQTNKRITSVRKFAGASNPLDTATAGSVYNQDCDVPINVPLLSGPALCSNQRAISARARGLCSNSIRNNYNKIIIHITPQHVWHIIDYQNQWLNIKKYMSRHVYAGSEIERAAQPKI